MSLIIIDIVMFVLDILAFMLMARSGWSKSRRTQVGCSQVFFYNQRIKTPWAKAPFGTWVGLVLMPILSGSYDGTVRLSSEKWDQVLEFLSSTFPLEELTKCVLDTGGMRVFAVRYNGCAPYSTLVSSLLKLFTPSHRLSLPP